MRWLVCLLLVGCSKPHDASCKDVVRHIQDVANAEHDDRTARALAGTDPVKRCEDAMLTATERTCMVRAKTMAAIEVCGQDSDALKRDRAKAAAQRVDAERAEQEALAKFQHDRDAKLDAGAPADAR